MIETIRKLLKTATGLPVKPLSTGEKDECIVYTFYPEKDNGAVSTSRLELRLITKTYEKATELRKIIIKTLVNTGDNIKIDGIYNCDLNGGGQLKEYETNTIHTIMYFDLITRSDV